MHVAERPPTTNRYLPCPSLHQRRSPPKGGSLAHHHRRPRRRHLARGIQHSYHGANEAQLPVELEDVTCTSCRGTLTRSLLRWTPLHLRFRAAPSSSETVRGNRQIARKPAVIQRVRWSLFSTILVLCTWHYLCTTFYRFPRDPLWVEELLKGTNIRLQY